MITVLQPDEEVTLGRFAQWLTVEYRTVELFKDPVPALDEVRGGLIVLGGRIDAYELPDELCQLLRDAVAEDIPVLGICLGHQVLARAFGGEVAVGHAAGDEDGAFEIAVNAAGQADPVIGVLGEGQVMPESHHDVVTTVPQGAVVLASSERCAVQAMRIGSAVSTQFHPEASPEIMGHWRTLTGQSREEGIAEMERVDGEVARGGEAIARAFSEVVAARTAR
ncbi:type 1 glutamine amidotransferase [uncultured Corynebacterium sp.]|uniref:type 1 glutamine amidotransferase n=1 Tax=uncultured Corynebacterium sp. TaxID=159447 RepID=UPI0025DB2977|nr:type 1 glutamine amidotransferase [uncultured Corynebacterium sp.]